MKAQLRIQCNGCCSRLDFHYPNVTLLQKRPLNSGMSFFFVLESFFAQGKENERSKEYCLSSSVLYKKGHLMLKH